MEWRRVREDSIRRLQCLGYSRAVFSPRGRRGITMKTITVLAALLMATVVASAETLQGKWKLVAAEDLRPDGTVARYPWGRHPIGAIVVQGGSCYVQIMSSDVPDFSATDTSAT